MKSGYFLVSKIEENFRIAITDLKTLLKKVMAPAVLNTT